MPTLPPEPVPAPLHTARPTAESFGTDPRRYDEARPAYPDDLIARIVTGSPGPDLLDVGCGTGIAARQFRTAGCEVLGVEPDPRMAEVARTGGLRVEVATFEEWQPDGRTFDAVTAAQSWHWIDPAAGARKAAQVLRPYGRLAIFGHVFEPPAAVAEPFAAAFRSAAPESFLSKMPARPSLDTYRAGYAGVAATIRETRQFTEPEQWQFDWERPYSRDEWLTLLPTTGGLTRLAPDKTAGILAAVGAAIDELGGRFTMRYTTLAVSAVKTATQLDPVV